MAATKICTKNPAISKDWRVFVFRARTWLQENQRLGLVGSNHPQPIAVGTITARERRGPEECLVLRIVDAQSSQSFRARPCVFLGREPSQSDCRSNGPGWRSWNLFAASRLSSIAAPSRPLSVTESFALPPD